MSRAATRSPLPLAPAARAPLEVRAVMAADLPAITEIQAERIRGGAVSPVVAPLDLRQVTALREKLAAHGYPCLVAVRDGEVLGFAFAQPFTEREAWKGTVEGIVASRIAHVGKGVGPALLAGLVTACEAKGFRQVIAVLPADAGGEEAVAMHEAAGFSHAGILRGIGLSLGAPVDSLLMQRPLRAAARGDRKAA